MTYNPTEDGYGHINVYSKGRTEIGRLLSNFAKTPFVHPEDGEFDSVEGYWYWLGSRDNVLRRLSGSGAKVYGRRVQSSECLLPFEEFKRKVILALDAKLDQNPKILELLKKTNADLVHYYVFNGAVVEPAEHKWIIQHLEMRRAN